MFEAWEYNKWYQIDTFEKAYRLGVMDEGFLLYAPSLEDADFNPSGVSEACVAVDGSEGLEIIAAKWDGSHDCFNWVNTTDGEWWMLKPKGPYKG